jgi:hypothetical protein
MGFDVLSCDLQAADVEMTINRHALPLRSELADLVVGVRSIGRLTLVKSVRRRNS